MGSDFVAVFYQKASLWTLTFTIFSLFVSYVFPEPQGQTAIISSGVIRVVGQREHQKSRAFEQHPYVVFTDHDFAPTPLAEPHSHHHHGYVSFNPSTSFGGVWKPLPQKWSSAYPPQTNPSPKPDLIAFVTPHSTMQKQDLNTPNTPARRPPPVRESAMWSAGATTSTGTPPMEVSFKDWVTNMHTVTQNDYTTIGYSGPIFTTIATNDLKVPDVTTNFPVSQGRPVNSRELGITESSLENIPSPVSPSEVYIQSPQGGDLTTFTPVFFTTTLVPESADGGTDLPGVENVIKSPVAEAPTGDPPTTVPSTVIPVPTPPASEVTFQKPKFDIKNFEVQTEGHESSSGRQSSVKNLGVASVSTENGQFKYSTYTYEPPVYKFKEPTDSVNARADSSEAPAVTDANLPSDETTTPSSGVPHTDVPSGDSTKLAGGAVAGIVIGVLSLIAVLAAFLCFRCGNLRGLKKAFQ